MQTETKRTRNAVPIIYVKGTHYEVGFEIGRTFKSMIQSHLEVHKCLNDVYLPLWKTPEGKQAYEATLSAVVENYPQYVEELKGTAEGAEVPFHKLFLIHMDDILPNSVEDKIGMIKLEPSATGCSTVCGNYSDQVFLAHNEDTYPESFNHFYFVSAHIIEPKPVGKWKVKEEKFTSLCYAGSLPGFTMSYNQHGLVFTVNIIRARDLHAGKTPRYFLTRALLCAENITQATDILKDSGTGIGDSVHVTLFFLKNVKDKAFYSVEVGPPKCHEKNSFLDVLRIPEGENYYHTNRLLRLKCAEKGGRNLNSSLHREAAMNSLPVPRTPEEALVLLGDVSDSKLPVFREFSTISTGLFDMKKLTWRIYTENPKSSKPILEIPMVF